MVALPPQAAAKGPSKKGFGFGFGAKGKKSAMSSAFEGADDEEQAPRKLMTLDDDDGNDKDMAGGADTNQATAAGGPAAVQQAAPAVPANPKNMSVKMLIDSIPTKKEDLFAYKVSSLNALSYEPTSYLLPRSYLHPSSYILHPTSYILRPTISYN
jgi:hypothetical protein